jgi:short-subunit dehydrogenase
MDIQGKSCIVTGASSGIGAATARRLYGLGGKLTLAARTESRLRALAEQLPGSRVVVTDVTNPTQVRRLVTETLTTFGGIHVLVNAAGQGLHVPLLQIDPMDLRAVFDLNVVAPLVTTQSVLPAMVAAGGGAIVNVSSAATLTTAPRMGGYVATKAALNMLSDVSRVEFADKGVAISVVYPYVTDTGFHRSMRAGPVPGALERVRRDEPDLVAKAIVFAIRSGAAHVRVANPPEEIDPRRDGVRRRGDEAVPGDAGREAPGGRASSEPAPDRGAGADADGPAVKGVQA